MSILVLTSAPTKFQFKAFNESSGVQECILNVAHQLLFHFNLHQYQDITNEVKILVRLEVANFGHMYLENGEELKEMVENPLAE